MEFKPGYFDLLILDYRMSPLNGIELFGKMKELHRSAKPMLLTASHEQRRIDNIKQLQQHLDFNMVRRPATIARLLQEIYSSLVCPPILSA